MILLYQFCSYNYTFLYDYMAVSNMFGEHAMCVIFVIIEERPSWLLQIVKYHATCTLLYCADHMTYM